MYFLIRYIYNNIFYYKSDRIVKILVKLSTVFYFLSIKFCTVNHYPCSKLLSYTSYGNSCLYTIYIGNKAQKSQQHLQQFRLKSHSCAVVTWSKLMQKPVLHSVCFPLKSSLPQTPAYTGAGYDHHELFCRWKYHWAQWFCLKRLCDLIQCEVSSIPLLPTSVEIPQLSLSFHYPRV